MSEQFILLDQDNYHSAYHIHCHGHPVPWSEGVFTSCLTDNYFAQALCSDEQVSGYFIGLQVVDECTLMDIAVCPSKRGRGAGASLLQHFIEACNRRGATKIWLEVRASNDVAISLYENHDFALIETRKGYYQREDGNEDALVMCLKID